MSSLGSTGSPGAGTRTCSPSTSTRARLTLDRSAPLLAPPAASTACATRDPSGSSCTPGRFTCPTTWTTTTPDAVAVADAPAAGTGPPGPAGDGDGDDVGPKPCPADSPTPTGAPAALRPVGPARDPPPGAMTVPWESALAHRTRSPNTATVSRPTTTTPRTAARRGSQRAPTNAAGSRTQTPGTDRARVAPGIRHSAWLHRGNTRFARQDNPC